MIVKMTNKIILLLSMFLSSCICKKVTFHKSENFPAYVRLTVVDKNRRIPPLYISMLNKNSHTACFEFYRRNLLYRMAILSEDGKTLTETSFVPNNVKNVEFSPNSIRKE